MFEMFKRFWAEYSVIRLHDKVNAANKAVTKAKNKARALQAKYQNMREVYKAQQDKAKSK